MPEKVGERRSTGSHCSAPVANTSVVATTVEPSHSNSCYSTSAQGLTDTSSQQDGTPLKDQAKDGGMSVIREFYQTQGISQSATNLLLASWRGGTKKQYDVYIKKWTKFCAERQADQFLPLVVDVLDFLTELYEKGFTYSAINTARSALSSFVQLDDGSSVGKNPLISRLLKGVFQSRAPKPKYSEVWDVQIVLSYLKTLHPVDSLRLKDLSFKFLMLLLLVSGQRGQTIHMLDLNDMIVSDNGFTFVIVNHLKQSRPGYQNPQLKLVPFEDSSLCVVTTCKEYLKRTKSLRGNQSKLFISYVKPFKEVSRDTLTRWVRQVMAQSGLDVAKFSPHSTRAASVSAAHRASVNLDDILKTAGWSSECCFAKYYNKPIVTASSFANAVLSVK